MSRRRDRSRCYVCRTWLVVHKFAVTQMSYSQGWHVSYPLCAVCAKVLFEMVAEVRKDYA